MGNVTILPFDRSFDCDEDESVLSAALRQGLFLRYGCRHGGCGTCKARLIDGDVASAGSSFALAPDEQADGLVLLCSTQPVGDCVIDVSAMDLTEEEFEGGDQVQELTTRVDVIEQLTPDTYGLRLQLLDPGVVEFVAGQFVNVRVPGTGQVRSYSIANPPHEPTHIDLIVKLLPGGLFSNHLASRLAVGDHLQLLGPLGQLKVRLSYRRILMVAGGSGLAPFLSMLHDLADRGDTRPVELVFGDRRRHDMYRLDQIERLGGMLQSFTFVPALSEPEGEAWEGETGLVTEVIARRHASLEGHDAFLAGPPPMIEAAIPLLVDLGVRSRNIYFDAFVPTGG